MFIWLVLGADRMVVTTSLVWLSVTVTWRVGVVRAVWVLWEVDGMGPMSVI
jgi:hypothetical protein